MKFLFMLILSVAPASAFAHEVWDFCNAYDANLAIEADGGAGNQWLALGHAGCIHSLPSQEVVAAIQHHIRTCNPGVQVFGICHALNGRNLHQGV